MGYRKHEMCRVCKSIFVATRPSERVCRACKQAAANRAAVADALRREKKTSVSITCRVCGKSFRAPPHYTRCRECWKKTAGEKL